MAEIVVMRQSRLSQRGFDVGKMQSLRQRPVKQCGSAVLVLRFDRSGELGGIPGCALCSERMALFAQRVEGDISERLGRAGETRRLVGESIAQANPSVCSG